MDRKKTSEDRASGGSAALKILLDRWRSGTFGEILEDWRWILTYTRRYRWAVVCYTLCGVASASLSLLSAVAQTIWSALTRYNPVGRVAVYGFLNPMFGVLLSALLLREGQQAFTPYSLAALVLVCVGIFVVNRSDAPGRGAQANQQP